MEKLLSHRKQIEIIDKKIILLLGRRFDVAKKIGAYKRARGLKLLDTERERELMEVLIKEGKKLGISKISIRSIWPAILRESLSKE